MQSSHAFELSLLLINFIPAAIVSMSSPTLCNYNEFSFGRGLENQRI